MPTTAYPEMDWQKKLEEDLMQMQQGPGEQAQPTEPAAEVESPPSSPAPAAQQQQAQGQQPAAAQQMAPGAPTMAPPPPPPPPAAPSPTSGYGLPQAIDDYALEWLGEPNRFMSDVVQQTRAAGDQRRQLAAEAAERRLDELFSSRNILGSNIEADAYVDLGRRLAADVSDDEARLLEMLAGYEAQDRLAAGEYGLDVAEFGRAGGLAERELDLREREIEQTGELAREEMSLTERLQGTQLAQRESEFARSFGLDEQEFQAQQDQFTRQFGEQVASRLQQDAQFRATLEQEDAQFAVESGLRSRALDLQEEGMTMDDAYRQAALDQERELTTSAQELQRYGIDQESAYRYAALEQDGEFRERTLDLQEQGMELDEAYRQAELEFRQRSTEQATLVQLLSVLADYGGLSDNARDLIQQFADTAGVDLGGYGDEGGGGGGEGGGGGDGSFGNMTDREFYDYLRTLPDEYGANTAMLQRAYQDALAERASATGLTEDQIRARLEQF